MEIEKIKNEYVNEMTTLEKDDLIKTVRNLNSYRNKFHKLPAFVRNRRYNKLKMLIDEDEHFSEENIKFRDPLLYFIYVGRFKRDGNQKNQSLNEFLTDQSISNDYLDLILELHENKKIDDETMKEEYITPEELEDNEDELIQLMHDKFLCGYDYKYINYDIDIDNNLELDDLKQINQDLQDKYFENDLNEYGNTNDINTDNGIQDF